MGVYALTSSTIYVGGADLSGDLRQVEGTVTGEELDVTNFGSGGWRQRIIGLHDVDATAEGFLNLGTGNVEESLYALVGSSTASIITLGPTTGAQGEAAELFRGVQVSFSEPETVGEAAKFTTAFKGHAQFVRGNFLGAKTSTSSSSSTSAVSQAAVGTTSKVYATLHVFTAATSLNVQVQSAATSSFAGATTRIQFDTTSATGGTWGTPASGPVTDTNWRINYTIASGTFAFAVAMGIQI